MVILGGYLVALQGVSVVLSCLSAWRQLHQCIFNSINNQYMFIRAFVIRYDNAKMNDHRAHDDWTHWKLLSQSHVIHQDRRVESFREACFHSVIVPHMAMYQSKTSFLNGERAGVRVTI